MFKRLRWITLGALAGVSGSIWVQRKVRGAVDRMVPQQVASRLQQRVGQVRADLEASVREGREAMEARDAELRARLPDGVTPMARPGVIEAVAFEAAAMEADGQMSELDVARRNRSTVRSRRLGRK
jgi:hypothetical protein